MDESCTNEPCPATKETVEPPPRPSKKIAAGNDDHTVTTRLVEHNGVVARDATTKGECAAGLPHRNDSNGSGRERLKRYREEVAGGVAIPDKWEHESFLVEWIDCKAFDALLAPKGIESAREALVVEGRRAGAAAMAHRRLRIEGRC